MRSSRFSPLRESMWFVPGLMVLGAVLVAQGVIWVDLWLEERALEVLPDSFLLGVEGSRGILVAVGGSVLAVAATTFSITMSVIATASSTYGPRLVRNFMADRSNQRVLGLFVATFVYCLMVMRRVQDATDGITFVPHVAVYGALVLALASVAALVYFLHHISDVIQVSTLIRRVRTELERAVDAVYGSGADGRVAAGPFGPEGALVLAPRSGYVTSVDAPGLARAAAGLGLAELTVAPGTHVMTGEPLARVRGAEDEMSRLVVEHVRIGDTRTPAQDVRFAVQQLLEMAVRAVSPSTNDPYTARNVVEELACGLVPAMRHPAPGAGWADEDGVVRVVWPVPSGAELVDLVFDDLRNYAASDPAVVHASLRLAARIARVAAPDTVDRLHEQVDALLARAGQQGVPEIDLGRLRAAREDLLGGGRDGRPDRQGAVGPT
jgi:uncharacterized membrane protein